jgi:hypothetical protein
VSNANGYTISQKEDGKWYVYDQSGNEKGGPHNSFDEANDEALKLPKCPELPVTPPNQVPPEKPQQPVKPKRPRPAPSYDGPGS